VRDHLRPTPPAVGCSQHRPYLTGMARLGAPCGDGGPAGAYSKVGEGIEMPRQPVRGSEAACGVTHGQEDAVASRHPVIDLRPDDELGPVGCERDGGANRISPGIRQLPDATERATRRTVAEP